MQAKTGLRNSLVTQSSTKIQKLQKLEMAATVKGSNIQYPQVRGNIL